MAEPLFDATALSRLLVEVLPAIERDRLAPVLDELWACGEFAVGRAPRPGLLMCPVRDPFDTEFFLGEVLVTTAEVRCGGRTGHGAIIGEEPEKALLLAAVDAALAGGRFDLLKNLMRVASKWSHEASELKQLEAKLAAATRVEFKSMKKERVDFGSLG
jgi:alpha-D-ribose 1-methylphosphonate 5-triphosphate synthase subunit PhnG